MRIASWKQGRRAGSPWWCTELLPGSRPSPGTGRGAPNEVVTPASNQHIEPALMPHSTMPRSHASRRIASTPWARQTASRFSMLPPPT